VVPGPGPAQRGAGADQGTGALDDPARLREPQEGLGRLGDFAARSQAENTPRSCASDLEDFRHWCGGRAGSGFRPGRTPVAHAFRARAEAFSLAILGGSALGGCFKR
jgi:hypothetical protein